MQNSLKWYRESCERIILAVCATVAVVYDSGSFPNFYDTTIKYPTDTSYKILLNSDFGLVYLKEINLTFLVIWQ